MIWLFIIPLIVLLAVLLYWLLVTTEGVYLGRRMVIWLYDITSKKYDSIKQYDAVAEHFFVVRPLMGQLKNIPAPRILDVATGTGRLPSFVLEDPRFHGRIIGLDPSRRMLTIAAEKLRPYDWRVSLVQQTAVPLPFPANSFDAVTCLEALEFMPSADDALREMVRVLKPGGILFVTRRQGWEAKTFVGRYRAESEFESFLQELGLDGVNSQPWQIDYSQVWGRKKDD